jgi:hypothetical protein
VGFDKIVVKAVSRNKNIVAQRYPGLDSPAVDVDAPVNLLPFASGDKDNYQCQ